MDLQAKIAVFNQNITQLKSYLHCTSLKSKYLSIATSALQLAGVILSCLNTTTELTRDYIPHYYQTILTITVNVLITISAAISTYRVSKEYETKLLISANLMAEYLHLIHLCEHQKRYPVNAALFMSDLNERYESLTRDQTSYLNLPQA